MDNEARLKKLQRPFQLFLISLILSLPFIIEAAFLLLGSSIRIGANWQLLCATLIQLGCGWPLYRWPLKFSADAWIAWGTAAAYVYSLFAYFLHLDFYFFYSALTLTLTWFGKWLEEWTEQEAAFADQISAWWLPACLAMSFLVWMVESFYFNESVRGFLNALLTLAIACPCAVKLAAPIPLLVGGGNLSISVIRKIRQNVILAFIFNALAIPLAVAGLLTPFIAAGTLAMGLVALVANSFILFYTRSDG